MTDIAKVNVARTFPVWVFDSSGAPVTGLVDADFTKYATKDGAVSGVAITVAETDSGTRPGRYDATVTPNAVAECWEFAVGPNDAACLAHSIAKPALQAREFKVTALGIPTVQELVDAVLDLADTIDGEETLRGALQLITSFSAGEGGGSVDDPYLDLSGTKERIAATFKANGARDTVTRDST